MLYIYFHELHSFLKLIFTKLGRHFRYYIIGYIRLYTQNCTPKQELLIIIYSVKNNIYTILL